VIIAEAEPVELPGPRIIYVNQAFSRMTGFTPEEVMGKTPRILQGPQTDRNELRKIRKALKTWQSERVEVINYRKDGSEFWVEFEVVPVADEAGWYTHWVSVQRDITDRKVAEQKLRETTNLYQQILDAIPDFVLCKGAQSGIIYANKAFRNYYGMTQEQLQGIIDAPFVKPDYTQQYVRDDAYVFNTGQTLKIEEPVVRYDGSERLFSTLKSAIFDARGQVIQTVGVSRDITERKQAEERLQLLERAIAASNNGIFISDAIAPQNPIIYVNSGFERMTGYRKEEVLGKKCCSFDPTCTMPAVLEQLQCANTEGKETQVTLRNSRKDGTHFWCELCITPVRDASGRLTNFIGVLTDISDRIAVQESLRESEERFRTMADSTAVMLWVTGKDGQSTFVNKTWLEFTGRTLEDELSISWLEDIHPDERQRCLEQYLAAFEARESFEIEYRLKRFDGEYRWIVDLGKPRFTPNGSFAGYIGSCLDITERKRAEIEITNAKAALERQIQRVLLLERITQEIRSSLKVEQIFQTAATQIGKAFGVNRGLIHTYVDYPIPEIPLVAEYKQPGLESIMGLVIPVIGNPHAELMLTLDSAIASDDIYAEPLLEAASSFCQHLGLKSMLAVRTSYQGKPNGAIGLHQYDRFRHWAEEEIQLLEAVAAQVGIAIAQANLLEQEKQRRRELAAQNHALERAKLDAEAANRAKSQFLSKMSHELRTPLNAILGFTQVMARNNSLSSEQTEHLEIINRSGEHLLELINDILSMSKIEAGQVTLNENCFNLYRLLDSLEEMLRLKASSKGLQLIFERASDVPQYIRADESKLRQVLINLLGNAIKFTQQGSVTLRVGVGEWGTGAHTIAERDEVRRGVGEWGSGAVGEWEQGRELNTSSLELNSPHLPISLSPCPPLTKAPVPPSPSSPYSLLPTPYSLSFAVEDTGPGIAPQELDTLFDPFVQTQTGRKSMEGTGLGLPISQHFVRIMGGDISVRSTLGQGSIFTFDIQVGLATSADEEPISSKRRVIGLEPNQPSYRILIVEDAAVNRKLLVEMLEPLGFEVCEAANGQEGVVLWESWSPHLILMDIIMPVMDGYEATWQIKRLSCPDALLKPKGQDTAIIALTASAFEEQRDAVLRAGCDDFIPKPFREEVLLEKIALHLGVSYVYEEQQPSNLPQLPDFVEQLSPEALAVMPASWVTQLHQAALYADEEIMNQLIEQIPLEHAFLRRALKALVDNFQLEQIIDLTEPAE
jgi:PAS domain S-box-containing protein